MEERDGHLFAEMSKRRRSVMPLTWRIVPPCHPSAQEKAMADAATEWFSDLPEFETLLFDLLDAIGHGFAAVEIEWKQAENIWLPCAFYKRPQRWFQTATHDRNTIRLIDGSLDGAGLNPFGWLLHRHQAKSGWVAESGLFRVLVWVPIPTGPVKKKRTCCCGRCVTWGITPAALSTNAPLSALNPSPRGRSTRSSI
uniref:Uncharacterized protein n=1 Tax=Glossina brevipalpis TaxID=37001 RepID=A0A1A9WVY1_9MUSC